MIRFIVLFLVSLSLALTPLKRAHAFVPAAALAGYIITTGGTAYRIGQAGAAIGALAVLLLSSDSQSNTKGRIALKTGYEPVPRISYSDTSTKVFSPPPNYSAGCRSYRLWRANSTGAQDGFTASTPIACADAWQQSIDWLNSSTPSITKLEAGVYGDKIHAMKGANTDTNYSTDISQGFTYQPSASRTVSDQLSDVKLELKMDTGKIEFSPYKDDPDFQTQVDGGSTHPVLNPDTGALTMYGVTSGGQQRTLQTVINNTDGTVDVIETTNNSDGSSVTVGRTTVDYNTGSILSATTSTQTGRVSTPTTTTVETFPEVSPQPGTGTGVTA